MGCHCVCGDQGEQSLTARTAVVLSRSVLKAGTRNFFAIRVVKLNLPCNGLKLLPWRAYLPLPAADSAGVAQAAGELP
jgi:hypothetical protein